MDVPISIEVTRRRKLRSALLIAGGLVMLGLAGWGVRSLLTTTLHRSDITIAVVGVGDIENTINATGQVLPEFEETITSSIDGSVQQVLKVEGARVSAGESILTLDKSSTHTEYEKLRFQLDAKRSEISKLKLDLTESYSDIQSNNDIKQLRIGNLTDAVENSRRLFDAGGGTREEIEQAELNLKVAQLEKKQLENEVVNKQQTMQLEIKDAELAAQVQESDLTSLQHKLDLANVTATRSGIITYVNRNIGAKIREGETLATIADLSSFKISGSISDTYLDQLTSGMSAIIRINDVQLRGHVINIYPAVQNGIISFDIRLDPENHPPLHPNMKVDVFLITATDSHVLRVTNGPAFKPGKTQDIFVLALGKARRVSVRTGLSNFDFIEIRSGLRAGDTVITSDLSDYKNVQELDIQN